MPSIHKRRPGTVVLLVLSLLLLLSLGWLASWVLRFGRESLQMDLSAFYTAGEALNHGLSPYRSYPAARHAIWDGVDLFEHSRFLYPPQTAVLFRPLAWLPYALAKRLWMALSLGAVAASLFLTGRAYGLKGRWVLILGAATFAALYYPLLTHLERGQIDALTLPLIAGVSVALGKRTRRAEYVAGALLCAATLLKLHCVYMLPFLAIRGKRRALLGYLVAGMLLALGTALTPGGIEATLGYVRDEMPRIARYGEWGTDEMRVDEAILKERLRGVPEGATIKDGVIYQRESFSFVSNGTLVRIMQRRLHKAQLWISNSQLSALVLAVLFVGMLAWQLCQTRPLRLLSRDEFLYWQVVALIVLLAAPLTWVMNLVWLLPLIVVVGAGLADPASKAARLSLIGAAVALVIIALPDGRGAPWIAPALADLIRDKYVIGEVLLLVSLLAYLSTHGVGNRAPDSNARDPGAAFA
jgi:hypothetical protein